jgi:chitin synthase
MEVSIEDADLNALYNAGLEKFANPAPPEVKQPNQQDEQEDYYKGFRSAVVLFWMFCNAVLIAVVLKSGGLSRLSVRKSDDEERRKSQLVEIYLKVVLWSVVSISRFLFFKFPALGISLT